MFLCLSVISGALAHVFRSLSRRAVREVLGVEKWLLTGCLPVMFVPGAYTEKQPASVSREDAFTFFSPGNITTLMQRGPLITYWKSV